jgi:hypothetical protein
VAGQAAVAMSFRRCWMRQSSFPIGCWIQNRFLPTSDDPLRGSRCVDRKLGIVQQSDVCCLASALRAKHPIADPPGPRGQGQRLRVAESLFFKAPYVWEVRWPRPGAKLRSPCRAVAYVHDRRLDAATDGGVTAILPV